MNRTAESQSLQTRMMFSASNTALITGITLAAILSFTQQEVIEPAHILAWFAANLFITLARASLVLAYQRAPESASMKDWLQRFRIGVVTSGLT